MNALAAVSITHVKNILTGNDVSCLGLESSAEVISRLKFIGHIQRDEKIDVKHVCRQPNTLTTKVSRAIVYPDNRANTLKFVKDVISRSLEIIEKCIYQGDALFCQSIVADLINAKNGMLNLKHTYSDDTKFCCDLDVVIEQIQSQLINLQKKRPDFFSTEKRVEEKKESK